MSARAGLLVVCECPGSRPYGPMFEELLGDSVGKTVIVRCGPKHISEMRQQLAEDSSLFLNMNVLLITGSSASHTSRNHG